VTTGEAAELADFAWALRLVFADVAAGRLDQAAWQVNGLLASTGARPMLDKHDDEPWHLHFHGATDSLVTGWEAGCATGLAVVLGSDLHGRLGVCTADRCDRVYVDTSKNGTRRFCSTTCQNRVKAAAFRARQA
jgi:predicted RNA-binding Zn ribbon-like protein